MATIHVDGKAYEVDDDRNLLDVCLGLGLNLPYFCWHPALGSVGACRQCAVKQFRDEEDTEGQIVMACMTPAADGARISIEDEEAVDFRASVIEWLMVNHPHDCPICDEGGECHLQDMTVMTGHVYRRYRFNKRTYRNQYLGPFINHEMNRCIQCYRCVRFYRDYAGGRDLDVFGAHDHVYFGRHEDGVLQNEFSGNLVEVCPTGVFTDKTLKQHYTRKWDLQTAPSICTHCGLGCNTIPGERYGGLRRIRNRYHREINGYFLCDRGRYGYEFVNEQRRIRRPLLRQEKGGELQTVPAEEAVRRLGEWLTNGDIVAIGSPRASLEANFALRTLAGPERFHAGFAGSEAELVEAALAILQQRPAPPASLQDVREADAALVLGEDATNTAPMLALALRRTVRNEPMVIPERLDIPGWHDAAVRDAVQDEKGPLFVATPSATKLDDVAEATYRAAPDDLARLAFAVAHMLDETAPAVSDLDDETAALAETMANALRQAERPLIICGTSCGNQALLQAAANVARALDQEERPAGLCLVFPEANSVGLGLMGGRTLAEARAALEEGKAQTLVILENDLYRRAEPAFVDALLAAAQRVVVLDHLENDTTVGADLVLPAATFAEGDGTLVNNEGRAQRFYQVFVPEDGDIQESWRWLRDGMLAAGRKEVESWGALDEINGALVSALPAFEPVLALAPPAGFRIAGQKLPRQPHRYSGRTAMRAHRSVHEPKPPDDPDTPLSFSMEGYKGRPPGSLAGRYWAPGWNSVQALNRFQEEIAGPLRGGDGGQRLIAPSGDDAGAYFEAIPGAFEAPSGKLLAVPLYHIFGSEELSVLTPSVAELAPSPYAALGLAAAAALEVQEGDVVALDIGGATFSLPVQITPSLPAGLVGIPVGLPEMPYAALPAWTGPAGGETKVEEAS